MAELNFGILDTQAPGRIAAMPQQREEQQAKNAMQLMQVQQAMGQNELAKYQLSSARRTDEETNKLRALYGETSDISDPNFIRKVYAINPEKGIALEKAISERADKKLTRTKTEGEIQKQQLEHFAIRLPSLAQDPSDAGIDRFLKEAIDKGVMSFELASAKSEQLKGLSLPERTKAILSTGQSAKDALAALVPKPTNLARMIAERDAMPFGRARDAMTDTIEKSTNENFQINPNTGKFEDRRQGRQLPGAAPASLAFVDPGIAEGVTPQLQASSVDEARRQAFAMNAAGLPVGIRGGGNALAAAPVNNMPGAQPPAAATTTPLNPRQDLENYQTTLELEKSGYRRTPEGNLAFIPGGKADPTVQAAQTTQKLSAKDLQKREAVYPQATAAIKGFETKADSFIKDLVALRDDVGLNQITGSIYGRTGSVSREGSRAQALYDKIVAKGGFQALQDLRDASKTGGALGNVSNQEGKQLTASFAAIDRRQNASDVQAAINQAIADIEGARIRTREAYDSTYAYKTPADSTAPPTAPVDMPSAAAAEIARRAAAKR